MSGFRCEKVTDKRGYALTVYLRTLVYVLEQNCPPCDEFDHKDDDAIHYLGWVDDVPVTTCRVYFPGAQTAQIGRIVTHKDHREKGFASQMLRTVIDQIGQTTECARISISAQTHAIGLYEKLGFKTQGPPYIEDNLPHQLMTMPIKKQEVA